MRPKISVIIPCYNVEKYLERCMKSVVNQTLKDIEIILVDDGSPDRVPQLCDRWALIDNRIKVVHKANGGLGNARNSGLDIASGEYVSFVDSDDFIDIEMLENLYLATENGLNDIIRCGCYRQLQNGSFAKENLFDDLYKENNIYEALYELIGAKVGHSDTDHRQSSVWCGIYKLSLINDNNIRFRSEKEFLCEDAIFHTELFKYVKSLKYVPKAYYYYCFNGVSLSHSFKSSKLDALEKMCTFEEQSEIANESNEFRNRILRQYAHLSNCMHQQILDSDASLSEKKQLCQRIYNSTRWSQICSTYEMHTMPLTWRCRVHLYRMGCFYLLILLNNTKNIIKKIVRR